MTVKAALQTTPFASARSIEIRPSRAAACSPSLLRRALREVPRSPALRWIRGWPRH